MRGPATLTLNDVSVKRGSKVLISNLSLSLSGPKLLWVTGGNGVGKTSLLRTCAGLSRAYAGEIIWSVQGEAITAPQAVSFLPAHNYAKSGLTAQEEATFWDAELASTNLETHSETLTKNLSTGQSKRLSLCKLLARNTPIWILDEPLAGLDQAGRDSLAAHLQAHVKSGGLALVASHAPISVQGVPTQKLILE